MTNEDDESPEDPINLTSLVNKAIARHRSTETIVRKVADADYLDYYGGWMAAEDILEDVKSERKIGTRELALLLVDQTTVTPSDLEFFFGGTPIDFDRFFVSLGADIVYTEMLRFDPSIREEDFRRDDMVAAQRQK